MNLFETGYSQGNATFSTSSGVDPEDDFKMVIAAVELRLEDIRFAAKMATMEIQTRPERGIDIHGVPFAPYSPAYAKEKGSTRVNLRSSDKAKEYWRSRFVSTYGPRSQMVYPYGELIQQEPTNDSFVDPITRRMMSQFDHMLDSVRYKVIQEGSSHKEIQIGVFNRLHATRARIINEGAIIRPSTQFRKNYTPGAAKAAWKAARDSQRVRYPLGLKNSEFIAIPGREFLGLTPDMLDRVGMYLLTGIKKRLGRPDRWK